jgi:hypothetical protein
MEPGAPGNDRDSGQVIGTGRAQGAKPDPKRGGTGVGTIVWMAQ